MKQNHINGCQPGISKKTKGKIKKWFNDRCREAIEK